jgi:hypothetical protein
MTSPGLSEVYGLRDSRLLGMATRTHPGGVWTVYLANGMNENAFARGQCRREQAASLNEVNRIFVREGLEFRANKPQNIPVPDHSIFEGDRGNLSKSSILSDPQVARKMGELMCAAANRVPETAEDRSPQPKRTWPSTISTGVRMNKKQKAVLIVVAVVVVAMLIFPPFHAMLRTGIVRGLGYSLISDPPQFRIYSTDLAGTVDIGLLVTQWLGVLIVGAIAFFILKD